jgi:hypothetical protein
VLPVFNLNWGLNAVALVVLGAVSGGLAAQRPLPDVDALLRAAAVLAGTAVT